jgi:transcription elongation factor SPT6
MGVVRLPKYTCIIIILLQYEPEALSRAFMTEQDSVIRSTDMPERFQLRQVPVKETEEGELEEEAEWIYKQAFNTPPVSTQVQ